MRNEIKLVDFDVLSQVARESSYSKSECIIGYQKDGSNLYLLAGDLSLHLLDPSQLKISEGDHIDLYSIDVKYGGKTLKIGNCEFKSSDVLKLTKTV